MENLITTGDIKVDDIVFVSVKDITSWTSNYYEGCNLCDDDIHFGFESREKYKSVFNVDDLLIAVKYLGEGLFEEMVTGEIFLAQTCANRYSDRPKTFAWGFDVEELLDEGLSVKEIVSNLNSLKELSNYSMVLLDEWEETYIVSDESMREYMKHSDEERRTLIAKIKEYSLKKSEKFIKQIDGAITAFEELAPEDVYEELTEENLNMAYLENQLFDFKHKVKTLK